MTKYEKKIAEIEQADIFLCETRSEDLPAKSFRDDDLFTILINESAFSTEAERYVALSHEKTHCDLGTFYTVNTPFMTQEWLEQKTWRHQIEEELPFDILDAAFWCCRTMDGVAYEDVAEHLSTTPDFIARAVEHYERQELYVGFGRE